LAAGAFDDFTLVVNFDLSSSNVAFEPFPIVSDHSRSFEFGGGAAPTDYTLELRQPTQFGNLRHSCFWGLAWHDPICQKIKIADR
jgi:hypothetical protein